MKKTNFADLPDGAFVRQPQVLEVVPFSQATLWRRAKEGTFPEPIKLSARVTCWKVSEVRAWMAEQAAQSYVPSQKPNKRRELDAV
jgi:prophage regulatory protein